MHSLQQAPEPQDQLPEAELPLAQLLPAQQLPSQLQPAQLQPAVQLPVVELPVAELQVAGLPVSDLPVGEPPVVQLPEAQLPEAQLPPVVQQLPVSELQEPVPLLLHEIPSPDSPAKKRGEAPDGPDASPARKKMREKAYENLVIQGTTMAARHARHAITEEQRNLKVGQIVQVKVQLTLYTLHSIPALYMFIHGTLSLHSTHCTLPLHSIPALYCCVHSIAALTASSELMPLCRWSAGTRVRHRQRRLTLHEHGSFSRAKLAQMVSFSASVCVKVSA